MVDELSKTRKPGPERWIVAFAFPILDSNYFFLDSRYKVQDKRFVSSLNTPLICYRYLTDGSPMHC